MKQRVNVSVKYVITLMSFYILTIGNYAYASDPKIVTGTKNLFTDAGKWILILDPIIAGVVCGVLGLQWFFGDEGDKKSKIKAIKGVFGVAVFIETASALVTFILSYYS